MSKHVRFSPPTYHNTPRSPLNDAALTMLDLRCAAVSSGKRNVSEVSSTQQQTRTKTMRLVSPNEEEPRSNRLSTDSFPNLTMPAPPFSDEEPAPSSTNTKIPAAMNPLDLLSAVSVQMAPEAKSRVLPSVRAAFMREQREVAQETTHVLPCVKADLEARRESPPQPLCIEAAASADNGERMQNTSRDPATNTQETLVQGFKRYTNGSTYLGHFLSSLRHSFGICTYPQGHEYTGLWYKGVRSGLGVMRYSNGDRYEGHWKNDLREGKGVFYHASGEVDVGLWKEGRSLYGVRWSGDRERAWRLVDGCCGKRMELRTALDVGREVGVEGEGVP